MVVAESEIIAQTEVDSSAMPSSDHHQKTHVNIEPEPETNSYNNGDQHHHSGGFVFPNLGRQASIYSLTLDEFQHTLCEGGKNFGSMNMDEFLNSIWTAEENQAHHSHQAQAQTQAQAQHNQPKSLPSSNVLASSTSRGAIAKQPSLTKQGSLSLPAPLCRKTVDEVWSEIQNQGQSQSQNNQNNQNQNQNQVRVDSGSGSGSAQRQPTFGEMTLEDFLVKAGVVREQCGPTPVAVAPPQHHPQYGFASPHTQMGSSFVTRPVMPAYQPGNGKRNNRYPNPTMVPSVACYGGVGVNNGGAASGGFGAGLSPIRPVSPDGLCGPGQVDDPGGQYGMELAVLRGRKRIIDGPPVEKVVERRQRRMIKNRESAARSRARKQAYTVELEAELNQLREENTRLKQAVTEIERQRKQQYVEEQKLVTLSRAQRAQEKLKIMRRSRSCNL